MTQPLKPQWIKPLLKALNTGRSGDLDHFGCAEYNPKMVKEVKKVIATALEQQKQQLKKKIDNQIELNGLDEQGLGWITNEEINTIFERTNDQ